MTEILLKVALNTITLTLKSQTDSEIYNLKFFLCYRDRMVVGFSTTYAISANHNQLCEFESHSGEVYSILHHVIKFVSVLWQICGFLRVLWFPQPIKLTATI
jgi:hypothetical protein